MRMGEWRCSFTICNLGTPWSTNRNEYLKLPGLSPQANYTDRATAACLRSYYHLLRIEGVTWSAQRIPYGRNLDFLDGAATFSSK
jgi:hypothetical protein